MKWLLKQPKWDREFQRMARFSNEQAKLAPKTWRYYVILTYLLLLWLLSLPRLFYRWVTTGSFKEKEHPFWAMWREQFEKQYGISKHGKIDKT